MEMTIRTAAGDLRRATHATTGVVSLSDAAGSTAGAEAFAADVIARHAAGFAGVAPMELTLIAPRDSSVTNLFEMMATLAIRPSFVLRVAANARNATSGSHSAAAGGSSRRTVGGPLTPGARVRVLERLFARERRIETIGGTAPAWRNTASIDADGTPGQPPRDPLTALPEMVLRRRDAAPPARAEVAPPRDLRQDAGVSRPVPAAPAANGMRVPAAALALSSRELRQLTDEVVGAIDRRIIAQRERRGAI